MLQLRMCMLQPRGQMLLTRTQHSQKKKKDCASDEAHSSFLCTCSCSYHPKLHTDLYVLSDLLIQSLAFLGPGAVTRWMSFWWEASWNTRSFLPSLQPVCVRHPYACPPRFALPYVCAGWRILGVCFPTFSVPGRTG